MKTDIISRLDIEKLVRVFYEKLREDRLLSSYFLKVKDWEGFLKTVNSFWENVMFFTGNYTGHPMETHSAIHAEMPLDMNHFAVWTKIFNATVDELYHGPNADAIKQRANNIAEVMKVKILQKKSDTTG